MKFWDKLCELFGCEAFTMVRDDVTEIKGEVASVRAEHLSMQGTLAEILTLVTAINGFFPIVADVDLSEVISRLNALQLAPMSIWSPDDGRAAPAQGVVDVRVYFKGAPMGQFESFGIGNGGAGLAGVTFDTSKLQFVEVLRGERVANWAFWDAQEINPGEVVVGGSYGVDTDAPGDEPIIGDGAVHLFTLRFTTTAAVGEVTTITLQNYVDHAEGLMPEPCTIDVQFE